MSRFRANSCHFMSNVFPSPLYGTPIVSRSPQHSPTGLVGQSCSPSRPTPPISLMMPISPSNPSDTGKPRPQKHSDLVPSGVSLPYPPFHFPLSPAQISHSTSPLGKIAILRNLQTTRSALFRISVFLMTGANHALLSRSARSRPRFSRPTLFF